MLLFVWEFMVCFVMLFRMSRMFWGTRPVDTIEIALARAVVLGIVERAERPSWMVWMGVVLPVVRSDIRSESWNSGWVMSVLV